MTARSSQGLYLATHGGHNAESHNHNDVGDFIVYVQGEPLIIDAGRGNYTARTFSSQRYELWFTQSQYHNLPIINGYGQLAGRSYEAKKVAREMNPQESSLSMDISNAYPKEAGINYWNRLVLLNKTKEQIELTEDYNLKAKPVSLQQIFMTVCDIDLTYQDMIKLTTATPTDINALADEYLRMSYHSFQSKQKDAFEIKLITDFDNTLPLINVIPPDIGRVLLNLLNNAFWACAERRKLEIGKRKSENADFDPVSPESRLLSPNSDPPFSPSVTLTTKNFSNHIEIRIHDNGPGIPSNIINKIFQPFFTTKPTGQGTGLGLSLAYDIIKAHHGSINVISNYGEPGKLNVVHGLQEGSEFVIKLPI